jgi:hypothetical protein
MTDQAVSSLGVQILADGQVYGEIFDVSVPKLSIDKKEYKNQNATGGISGQVAGWAKLDDLKFKINYTGSVSQRALMTDAYARTKRLWTIVMPETFVASDGSSDGFTFTGFISEVGPKADGESVIEQEISVAVDGKMTPVTVRAAGLTTTFLSIVDDDSHTLTLVPAASASVYDYSCVAFHSGTAGLNTNTVLVTPTAAMGTIYVNGTVVASGAASGAIAIGQNIGDQTMISVVVTAPSKLPKIYWIRVVMGSAAYA